jgi:hypothetical protein
MGHTAAREIADLGEEQRRRAFVGDVDRVGWLVIDDAGRECRANAAALRSCCRRDARQHREQRQDQRVNGADVPL